MRAAEIPVEIASRVLNAGWAGSSMLARILISAVTGDYPDQGATIGLLAEVLE